MYITAWHESSNAERTSHCTTMNVVNNTHIVVHVWSLFKVMHDNDYVVCT